MGIIQDITRQSAIKVSTDLTLSGGKDGAKNREITSFPYHVYPEKIQSVISATSVTLNYPPDYTASAILVAASGAIGNTLKVTVKLGYSLTVQLYVILVGKPGTVKSHPITYAFNPIFQRDKDLYKMYSTELKRYESLQHLSSKELESRGEVLVPPILKKHLISDATTEAVTYVLSNNKRGLTCYNDEAIAWIKNLNRYRNGSDQEYWLSNWSGKPIISDRKSSSPIFISTPFISFIGTIQPIVLTELSKDGRDSNGFIDRILFAYPDNLIVNTWSDKELSDSVTRDYEIIISRLLDINPELDDAGEVISKEIRYSSKAFQILKNWQSHNASLCNSCEDPELSGVYSKLEIYCVRFSLILQAMYWASLEDELQIINERAVEGAILITEYFRKNAVKVFEQIHHTDPVGHLPENQQRLVNALPYTFKASQGQEIALRLDISERTYTRLLKNPQLFKWIKHGEYEKIIDGTISNQQPPRSVQ